MYHREDDITCKRIMNCLSSYGITVSPVDGQVSYYGNSRVTLNCSQLYLVRHAETVGIRTHRFMGCNSPNSHLTERGIAKLKQTARQIEKIHFNTILYSDIPRVKETANELRSYLEENIPFRLLPWMVGIDNAGWEERNREELTGIDAVDFHQREMEHNIFAKSSNGSSWGQVLMCCASLIEYLNKYCSGEKVLLISQGSIHMGINILLRLEDEPWQKYDSDLFFGLKENNWNNYGSLQVVYINERGEAEKEVAEG